MGKKRKNWRYCDAAHGSHGTMKCTACGKKITEGEYRVHETNEGFYSQHRACSAHDPRWAALDQERAGCVTGTRSRLVAYIAFRDKWHESALDDEIERMQTFLESDQVTAFGVEQAAPPPDGES